MQNKGTYSLVVDDVSHNVVEEECVVRDDQTRHFLLGLEVLRQPGDGGVVEMICRLEWQ